MKEKLGIVLVTYNRKSYLEDTLIQIFDEKSPIRDFDITILDNASTDGSTELIQEYANRFKNIKHIRHPHNIGGNANIARAFEYTEKEYLWVICDDDYYDWTNWHEAEKAVDEGHDVIVVDNEDMLDRKEMADIIFQLSFLPSGIYRTAAFTGEMYRNIYDNISNWYPHLPVGINIANSSKDFYILEKSCVTNGAAYNAKKNLPTAPASLHRGFNANGLFPEQQSMCWGVAYVNTLTLLNNEYDITHFLTQALKHPPSGVGHDYYTYCSYVVSSSLSNSKTKNMFYDVFYRVNWKLKIIMLYIKFIERSPLINIFMPNRGIHKILGGIRKAFLIKYGI